MVYETDPVDLQGESGKLSFYKYLYISDKKNIGRFDYGTASQLKSALLNKGEKKLYIIDLARSKGKAENQYDLLSVIECLKSGLIFSPIYGTGHELIIPPPHIIISSNYVLDAGTLRKDRWRVYELQKNGHKLGRVNNLIRKE